MSIRPKRYPKPNLLVLLTFFVGFGVVLTSIAHAAPPSRAPAAPKEPSPRPVPEQWLRSVWTPDLSTKLQNWKPRIRVDSDEEGVNLTRLFGNHGPALRMSTSMPDPGHNGIDGGASRTDASGSDLPEAYLYLFKRW
jgi:N-acetylmuramoyl-L-alanine amidase